MVTTATGCTALGNAQVLDWIRQWGNSTSEAILEPNCQIFSAPGIEGLIGFRVVRGRAVVLGDPVCAPANRAKLALAFYEFCQKNGMKIIYLLASEQFANWAIQNGCKVTLEICDDLAFDPQQDPTEGSKGKKLRNKISHTRHIDLHVSEYLVPDANLQAAMQKVADLWLNGRKGLQVHLGSLRLFDDRNHTRWFYVKDPEGNILSVALLTKLDAKKGWFLKYVVTAPEAPRGTSEFLMLSMMQSLKKEECHYFSVGAVPLEQIGAITGLGKFSQRFVRFLFSLSRWLFRLEHRKTYWQQFNPKGERSFIVFSHSSVGITDLLAILKVLHVNT